MDYDFFLQLAFPNRFGSQGYVNKVIVSGDAFLELQFQDGLIVFQSRDLEFSARHPFYPDRALSLPGFLEVFQSPEMDPARCNLNRSPYVYKYPQEEFGLLFVIGMDHDYASMRSDHSNPVHDLHFVGTFIFAPNQLGLDLPLQRGRHIHPSENQFLILEAAYELESSMHFEAFRGYKANKRIRLHVDVFLHTSSQPQNQFLDVRIVRVDGAAFVERAAELACIHRKGYVPRFSGGDSTVKLDRRTPSRRPHVPDYQFRITQIFNGKGMGSFNPFPDFAEINPIFSDMNARCGVGCHA